MMRPTINPIHPDWDRPVTPNDPIDEEIATLAELLADFFRAMCQAVWMLLQVVFWVVVAWLIYGCCWALWGN